MQFPGNIFIPFRLKMLLALLAAAGTGIFLSYSGFKSAIGPFSEDEAGQLLMARLDIAGAVINSETGFDLDRARLLAARAGIRDILAKSGHNGAPGGEKELSKSLASAAGGIEGLTALALADASGHVTASFGKDGQGTDLSRRNDFRFGSKGRYISAPHWDKSSIFYEITVPVRAAGNNTPLGALRCRFAARSAGQAALDALRQGGTSLALAKRGSQKILFTEGTAQGRELSLKDSEAASFLPALEGREGTSFSLETERGKTIYACRLLGVPDWTLALKVNFTPGTQPTASLQDRARIFALLSFIFLAAASFFLTSFLTSPLRDTAREAAVLLEECGRPAQLPERLAEPSVLSSAIAEAAYALKQQAFRDIELETETEKLREEEADLKTQNDELEKLNKYLMERETKISELKKEISELKEKVGSSAE